MIEFVSEVGVELIDALASDDDVAMAAWVSNALDSVERLSDRKRVKGLINFLWRQKHTSPFEHGIFKYKVDVPLTVAREFQRHRTFSFNEVSGRYTEMKPRFWMCPPDRPFVQQGKMGDYYFVKGTPDQYAIYKTSKERGVNTAWEIYQQRLDAGIAKEVAREDLPLSLMTQFYASVDPKNLMGFLALREHRTALEEIQQTARKMEVAFAERMPYTHEAYIKQRDLWEEFLEWVKAREEQKKKGFSKGGQVFTPDPKTSYTININTDNVREVDTAAILKRINAYYADGGNRL